MGAAGGMGLKGFQGLDGQWKGLSFPASAPMSGEEGGLDAVVSSSEDSSLAEALSVEGGLVVVGGEVMEGNSNRMFLRGDQPGGRRLINIWRRNTVRHLATGRFYILE